MCYRSWDEPDPLPRSCDHVDEDGFFSTAAAAATTSAATPLWFPQQLRARARDDGDQRDERTDRTGLFPVCFPGIVV